MSKWNGGQSFNTNPGTQPQAQTTPNVMAPQVTPKLEDLGDLIGKFRSKIMQTKHLMANEDPNTDGWVETTQEVIDYLYPRGLGKSPQTGKPLNHFIYDSVTCCLEGKKAEIQAQMELSTHDLMNDPLPGTDMLKT